MGHAIFSADLSAFKEPDYINRILHRKGRIDFADWHSDFEELQKHAAPISWSMVYFAMLAQSAKDSTSRKNIWTRLVPGTGATKTTKKVIDGLIELKKFDFRVTDLSIPEACALCALLNRKEDLKAAIEDALTKKLNAIAKIAPEDPVWIVRNIEDGKSLYFDINEKTHLAVLLSENDAVNLIRCYCHDNSHETKVFTTLRMTKKQVAQEAAAQNFDLLILEPHDMAEELEERGLSSPSQPAHKPQVAPQHTDELDEYVEILI